MIPDAIRAELRAHATEEAPNECCGLVLFRDDVAVDYIRGTNKLASPYRYELHIDVPADAYTIFFGLALVGVGRATLKDAALDKAAVADKPSR